MNRPEVWIGTADGACPVLKEMVKFVGVNMSISLHPVNHPSSSVMVRSMWTGKVGQESRAGSGRPGHWTGGGGRAGVEERLGLDGQEAFELNFEGP